MNLLDVNYVVTVRNILTESQCIILHKGIKRVRIRLKNSEHDAEAITYTGCSGSCARQLYFPIETDISNASKQIDFILLTFCFMLL